MHDLPFAVRLFADAGLARWRNAGSAKQTQPAPRAPRVVFTHGAVERERADAVAELLRAAPEHVGGSG